MSEVVVKHFLSLADFPEAAISNAELRILDRIVAKEVAAIQQRWSKREEAQRRLAPNYNTSLLDDGRYLHHEIPDLVPVDLEITPEPAERECENFNLCDIDGREVKRSLRKTTSATLYTQ